MDDVTLTMIGCAVSFLALATGYFTLRAKASSAQLERKNEPTGRDLQVVQIEVPRPARSESTPVRSADGGTKGRPSLYIID